MSKIAAALCAPVSASVGLHLHFVIFQTKSTGKYPASAGYKEEPYAKVLSDRITYIAQSVSRNA